ncbi:PREDICTED: BUD13 homolog [Fragaria vesca subsp. vesca]|uniref:BUD13 homolog n=1 Tax=Fragaria vesca subsp. vesca TaxID=101020 RepID=UPI0002C33C36|nr:PREDICTED: BUD13 homolog [Fragaria vesca subsp. vesca]
MADSAKSLKEYLKRYESSDNADETKKKRKKKQKSRTEAMGVRVVDEDPVWQKPVKIKGEDEKDSGDEEEEKPLVDEDIEVKRMRRLELLRARRPYDAISEDGSGWVQVPLKREGSEEADLSPPRKRFRSPSPEPGMASRGSDLSPPRKSRRGGDEDLSPPRKSRNNVEDLSPPRKSRNSVADLSPPRKSRNNVEDLSPPRKSRNNVEDLSPPRKRRINGGEDLSPPRKRQNNVADLSPPRKSRINGDADLSPPRKKKQSSPGPVKEKPKSGLISGRDISEEISKKKRAEQLRFQQMDPSETGQNAANVFRNKKTGERMSEEEKLKSEKKRDEKPKEIKVEWGKGLAQKREAEATLEALEREKEKPFARTRDDPELDKMMKEKVRWGDPMAHLVKKKFPEAVLANLGDSDKMKESGFIIPQDIPNHSWLKRGLDAAPNRYGIKPGRHWDGVDRSNGFEKKLFTQINEKQATQAEAYLWSVADM